MDIDLELKIKLFTEFLENGGYESIWSTELLEGLSKVKTLSNGKVDPSTVNSIVNSAMLAYCASQLLEPFNSVDYLSEYETLLQKSLFFSQINIETEKEFDLIFENFNNSINTLFRGLNEAKYRLYSSLQREWINLNLQEKFVSYQSFLELLLNNARIEDDSLLSKYISKIGIDNDNDLAVLSFLQHYGCPTPLLDWTYNFSNALFFSIENLNKPSGKREIENYFCVYYLEEKFLEKASMQEKFDVGLTNQKQDLKNQFIDLLDNDLETNNLFEKTITPEIIDKVFNILNGKSLMTYMTKIERLIKAPMLYFSDEKTDNNLKYNLNTNLNIVTQNGVFTWNSHPTKPIEQVIVGDIQTNEKQVLFSKCININKKLENYVRNKIDKLGVTKEYIYPDPYIIAKKIYKKTK